MPVLRAAIQSTLHYKVDAVKCRVVTDLGAGPLEVARYLEPFTMLVAKLAYEGDDGPALAYRFEHFEERS